MFTETIRLIVRVFYDRQSTRLRLAWQSIASLSMARRSHPYPNRGNVVWKCYTAISINVVGFETSSLRNKTER